MKNELAKCSFCGCGRVNWIYDESRQKYFVMCLGCGARTDLYQAMDDATLAWNARNKELVDGKWKRKHA